MSSRSQSEPAQDEAAVFEPCSAERDGAGVMLRRGDRSSAGRRKPPRSALRDTNACFLCGSQDVLLDEIVTKTGEAFYRCLDSRHCETQLILRAVLRQLALEAGSAINEQAN